MYRKYFQNVDLKNIIEIRLMSFLVINAKHSLLADCRFGKIRLIGKFTASDRMYSNCWYIYCPPTPPRERPKTVSRSAKGFSYHRVSVHDLSELVFREATGRLSKCRNYNKLETWIQIQGPETNQTPVLLKTDMSLLPDICWQPVAHQIQWLITTSKGEASVLDRNEIPFPGMSFFRSREKG